MDAGIGLDKAGGEGLDNYEVRNENYGFCSVSDDRFITTKKYILPDGSTMEGKVEMTRKVDDPQGKEAVLDER